jgi:DnaJ domain
MSSIRRFDVGGQDEEVLPIQLYTSTYSRNMMLTWSARDRHATACLGRLHPTQPDFTLLRSLTKRPHSCCRLANVQPQRKEMNASERRGPWASMTNAWLLVVVAVVAITNVDAFMIASEMNTPRTSLMGLNVASTSSSSSRVDQHDRSVKYLMTDFCLPSTGELIDPYKILKVSRDADVSSIKASYRTLSRRYHPDGPYLLQQKRKYAQMPHNIVWPGSCDSEDDVRRYWDKISFSYSILSNKSLRKRYDRHEALSDPGEALKRAALQAVGQGVAGASKSLWNFSGLAASSLSKVAAKAAKAAAEAIAENPTSSIQSDLIEDFTTEDIPNEA